MSDGIKDLTVMVKRVCFGFMLLWMAFIFTMSARNATDSTRDSEKIGMLVGQTLIKDFDRLPEEKQHAFAQSIDHAVRKTAHATEYAILGILALGVFCDLKKRAMWAFMTAALYAVTDEIHQLFVPGRSGKMTDVLIDSGGALLGILLTLGFLCILKKCFSGRC